MTKNNIILAVVIIILLSVAAWYFLGNDDTNSNSAIVSQGAGVASATLTDEGSKILSTLNRVNSITLNTGFLSSPAYRSLKESRIQIITQTTGRDNPFAPVPFDGKAVVK
ncbi:MAG: hypothetical protein WAV11_00270 [Minisyncoccia bacterium]